jgi:hypothetical protein
MIGGAGMNVGISGGGGGMAGNYASMEWVNGNFLSIAFFNRLFAIHGERTVEETTEEVDVLPNDVDTIINNIEAKFGLWTDQYLSALGYNASGGGGGGGASSLSQLTDVSLNNLTNGQALLYDAGLGKWVNGNVGGGGGGTGTVTSVGLNMPTGFSVSNTPITSAGTISVSFASGYGLFPTGTTWWGRSISNGAVSGSLSDVVNISMSGLISMENNTAIRMKDSLGDYYTLMTLNANNIFAVGYGPRTAGYTTDLQGYKIDFTVNTDSAGKVNAMNIDQNGLVWVKQGSQGLRIGDLSGNGSMSTIKWDAISGMLDIPGYAKTSAVSTLQGYFTNGVANSASQLSGSRTLWGNTDYHGTSNIGVSGSPASLNYVQHIYMSGNISMDNNGTILIKDSSSSYRSVFTLNAYNNLAIGYGTRIQGYVTDIQGGYINFAVNNGVTGSDSKVNAMEITTSGRVWVKLASQGLRIGDGLITWDSTNNALKVQKNDGSAANFYALGAVSALGFSAGANGTSIGTLTVNDQLTTAKETVGTSLTLNNGAAMKYVDNNSASQTLIGFANSGARVDIGRVDSVGNDLVYMYAKRFYLTPSCYLYVSSAKLYFYNGTQSIQITT